jgi:hypothetical protein
MAHQISVFLKNSDKMPSPSTKAFAILRNTDHLSKGVEKVANAIVTLLGIFY